MIDLRKDEREYVAKLVYQYKNHADNLSKEYIDLLRCYDDLKHERFYRDGGLPRSAIYIYYTKNSNITSQYGGVERFSNLIEEMDMALRDIVSGKNVQQSLDDSVDPWWKDGYGDTVFNLLFALNLLVMAGVFVLLM